MAHKNGNKNLIEKSWETISSWFSKPTRKEAHKNHHKTYEDIQKHIRNEQKTPKNHTKL